VAKFSPAENDPTLARILIKRHKWGDLQLLLQAQPLLRSNHRALDACAHYGTQTMASLLNFEGCRDAVRIAFGEGNVQMANYFRCTHGNISAPFFASMQWDGMVLSACILSGNLERLMLWMRDVRVPLVCPVQVVNRTDLLRKVLRLLHKYDGLRPAEMIGNVLGDAGLMARARAELKLTVIADFLLTEGQRYLPLDFPAPDIVLHAAHLHSVSALKVVRALGARDCYLAVRYLAATPNTVVTRGFIESREYAWEWLLESRAFWDDDLFLDHFAGREGVSVTQIQRAYAITQNHLFAG
jgi:hypothetical protein